jgi:dephospho-CoA kinase
MIIGITGSFGTGKTTVAEIFGNLGAHVIDADKIVHSFINAKARKELSKIVFRRKAYLELICKIVHPILTAKIKEEIQRLNPKKTVIVIDAPLLIESGLHKMVDVLVVVKTEKETQVKRAMKRLGLDRVSVLKRIRFQMPLKKKIKMADFIIDNESGMSQTRKQVKDIWKKII